MGDKKEIEVHGDDILSLPGGELTTVYHYLRKNKKQKEFVEVNA